MIVTTLRLLRGFSRAAVLVLLMTGCAGILTTDQPDPILVTLPASTLGPTVEANTPSSATEEGTSGIPVTQDTPTAVVTEQVPPTPLPAGEGIGATRKLWEWTETAPPSALAASNARLALIIGDGRFGWVNADSGQLESSIFLWTGVLQGESWGEVYVDGLGTLAAAAIREQHINPQTNLADSRARFAMFDANATELWSLPELGSQHFYSASLTSISVVVGKWPQGFNDNTLASYDLYTGARQWQVGGKGTETEGDGYRQILQDGNRLYVLVDGEETGAVVSYDLRTGDEVWRWSDPQVPRPSLISLGGPYLYVVSVGRLIALDPLDASVKWYVDFRTAPEAGLASRQDLIYLAPAPAGDLGFRPGIIALHNDSTGLAWHSLAGLLADPVAADAEAVWTIVKDFDTGNVSLSGLDPISGLEEIRIPISNNPDATYVLVPFNRRIYVLGDSLLAFGY